MDQFVGWYFQSTMMVISLHLPTLWRHTVRRTAVLSSQASNSQLSTIRIGPANGGLISKQSSTGLHHPLSYTFSPMLPRHAKAPHLRLCAKLHAASRRRPATLGPPSARWFPLAHRAGRSGLLSVRGRLPAPAFLGRREWLAPEHGLGPAL